MSGIEVAKPVIFLVGPTASGKTSLSIQIAKFLETEIISADSRYFYRKMDIGTAKPSLKEMDGIRHHMIDIADPSETISVAFFKEETEKIISALHEKQKIPIVVGGTGQYIHAIIHNWSMPQIEPEPKLREFLEKYAAEHGKEKLYKYLEKYDPEAAEIIDFRNVRRTIRAIEVIMKTGKRFSNLRKASTSLYDQKIIGIHWDREELYRRIDQRIEEMIANGFIEEVEKLMKSGYPLNIPAMSAIGYREIMYYLKGKCVMEEAITLIKRNSRQYVRRQANWFKESDPTIKWFDGRKLDINYVMKYLTSQEGWNIPY
jgi:tRNA dimethylallyltransferase